MLFVMFQIQENDAVVVVNTLGNIQISDEMKDNQVDSPSTIDKTKFKLTLEPIVMLLLLGASTSSESFGFLILN